SAPIIEHTDTSGFGSYDFSYPSLEEHMDASQFSGTKSRHGVVEDFNWLRTQQSPNWYAIPAEQEQRKAVQLSGAQVAQLVDMKNDTLLTEEQEQKMKTALKEAGIEL